MPRNDGVVHESHVLEPNKRVLIMTAVEAEREAVLRGLRDTDSFDVMLAGVGVASAAARTTQALAAKPYDLVVSAGIGGGFNGKAEIGSIVLAERIIAADLGAETAEGFCSVDELGFGSATVATDALLVAKLLKALFAANVPAHAGPVLTVSTATGTEQTASELAARVPGAAAEAMEGYGVAVAANQYGVPAIEIRAISNAVGPRNRAAWRMKEAMNALTTASSTLWEVLR